MQAVTKNTNVIGVSRSSVETTAMSGVSHIPTDVTRESLTRSMFPDKIQRFVYCPGSTLKTFFQQVDRLLAPEGIAVLQVTTIPDQHDDAYRKTHDWIQKHIFPGGLLPLLTILAQQMTNHTRLMIDHVENIGNHYATTFAHWHRRYAANRDVVGQLGFDRSFQRKWAHYFGSCEARFRERVLGDLQLVLTRQSAPFNLI